jgi:hypothetical protein
MRGLAVGIALSVVLSSTAAAAAPAWRPDVDAARAFAEQRRGEVAFAVRTEHDVWGHRMNTPVRSASVIKAMLMVAYLNHPAVRGRSLDAADRALLQPMIRVSDNETATRVRAYVGDARIAALARRARMSSFRIAPIWGRSQITAADQTRLFLRIDRLTAARHRTFAMRELGAIVAWQRWGIGQVRPRGWELFFKGGWGDGSGSVNHQIALLRRGRERVAVGVTTTGNPSHEYGSATLEGMFCRLLRGLAEASHPGSSGFTRAGAPADRAARARDPRCRR